jgi:hypothetical protein
MSRLPLAAAAALAALALTGCAVVHPPSPPTDADVESLTARIRERSWQNTGLPGEAPEVEAQPSPGQEESFPLSAECMADAGVVSFSWSFNPDNGYDLTEWTGSTLDDAEVQRMFYVCMATYPQPLREGDVASDAQLDYLYDLYQDVIVPCMIDNGYRLPDAPTRAEFFETRGQWSPYSSVHITIGGAELTAVRGLCGPDRPDLE